MGESTEPDVVSDVVVVGGGLVGVAAAAFLARQGVTTTLLERHPTTSLHPKARLVTVRSMELYRSLGIEDEVRSAGEASSGFTMADDLSGDLTTWIEPPADDAEAADLSPTTPYSCDQQRLEPILLDAARRLGADIRFSTEVGGGGGAGGVTQDAEGVTVQAAGPDGPLTFRARYLVAADGARSRLREQSGIAMTGTEVPGESVSAVFRADLEPALQGRTADAVFCRSAAAFLFARGTSADRRWQVGTYVRPEWEGRAPADLGEELTEVLRTATGIADLEPELEDVALWSTGAFVADRFRDGRIFFVGDAAHVMPPYGGLGGNTGVQDVHGLAWMLAAVLRGDGGGKLLDSYEAERRPIDSLTVDQALLRSRKAPGQTEAEGQIDALNLSLGIRYGDMSTAGFDDPRRPTMQEGTRAPHIALRDGRSVLDLCDPCGSTLVTGREGLSDEVEGSPRVVLVAPGDIVDRHVDRWEQTYGRAAGWLVRPDGVLAGVVSPAPDA